MPLPLSSPSLLSSPYGEAGPLSGLCRCRRRCRGRADGLRSFAAHRPEGPDASDEINELLDGESRIAYQSPQQPGADFWVARDAEREISTRFLQHDVATTHAHLLSSGALQGSDDLVAGQAPGQPHGNATS